MLSPGQILLEPTTAAAQVKHLFSLAGMSIPSSILVRCELTLSLGIGNLSPLFWDLGTVSHGHSKAGAHKASHFQGTDDYVYEERPCQALVQDDPAKAVKTADSYVYFALSFMTLHGASLRHHAGKPGPRARRNILKM